MPTGLVGRAAETAMIERSLDRAASGRAALLVFEGEPGIGKSRLLTQASQDAALRHMAVAVAAAREFEQTRPFGLTTRLVARLVPAGDSRRRRFDALVGGEGDGGDAMSLSSDPGLQFRLIDAVGALVEEVALAGPLLLGVDDLQWADPSSVLAAGNLVARLEHLPVAVVMGLRPIPRRPDLVRLLGDLFDAGAGHVELAGLEAAEVSVLAGELLGREPGPTLVSALEKTAGNPLFVTELLSAWRDDGTLDVTEGRAELRQPALSPTLRMTILRRLVFLSQPALDLLRAAAILGTGFTLADLSLTMSKAAISLLPDITEVLVAGIVEEDGDGLRFRHDLIRDAVYEELPSTVRRALHREAGVRLAAAGRPDQQVAEQLGRGATIGDAVAIEWLTRAARDAGRSSPAVAAGLFDRALDLIPGADSGGDPLRLERAMSLLLSGSIPEAIGGCRSLLTAGHEASLQASARVCLGHALLAAGQPADALDELLMAASANALAPADQANALAWAAFSSLFVGDVAAAAELSAQAEAAAASAGQVVATSLAINVRASVHQVRGELHAALAAIDDALHRADESPDRSGHRYPLHIPRAHILVDLDRVDDARAALQIADRSCDEMGMRWPLASLNAIRELECFVRGDWDEATVAFDDGAALADRTGERLGMVVALAIMALIRMHRNDLGGARSAAEAGLRDLTESGGIPFRGNWVRWAYALVLEAEGDPVGALTELGACWADGRDIGLDNEYAVFGADLVRLAGAAGDAALVEDVCAAVAAVAAANEGVTHLQGIALRCRGLADDDPEVLIRAAAALGRSRRALATALTAEEAGQALLRHGRLREGQAMLQEAYEGYQRLIATRDLLRVDAAFRGAGVRRGAVGPRRRPTHGWASLTPTERTVAELAAQGLSNPQIGDRLFVSHRTVQTHLSHIFTKLGIESRVQLTAEVTRRQVTQTSP